MGLRRLFTRSRRERGATIVEYTLLVAVLAVGTLAAVSTLQDSAERTTEKTAERISTRTIPTLDPTNPSPTVPTTTTTTPTTTTTKPPTTTTAPTTTTTKPPTTTTTKPPTTTTTKVPVATKMSAAWGSTSTSIDRGDWRNPDRWKMTATVTVTDDLGKRVSGASVRIGVKYYRDRDRTWRDASDITATTNANGQYSFDSGWYDREGNNRADDLRFTVKSVSKSGLTYTSGAIVASAARP